MGERTPLYEEHLAAGARLVPFGGWDMPLHYGSQLAEHHAVRRSWGVFDVSHMTVVDVAGPASTPFLGRLLANDIGKLSRAGRGLYSCMLNERGGVVDDLIVYRLADDDWRLVVNAATRDKDLEWLGQVAGTTGPAIRHRPGLVMLAVQGPAAIESLTPCLPAPLQASLARLGTFGCAMAGDWFMARTGYTGEDGVEIMLPGPDGRELWRTLLAAGAAPCGLGARDTLRLEAGLPLYGQDMDEEISPLEAGLGWTVALTPADRNFIGRAAVESLRSAGPARCLTGLILLDRGIMRHGQRVLTAAGDGIITSGGFAPTMERSIALARVPVAAGTPGSECQVEIRGALKAARIVRPPFVRHGRVLVEAVGSDSSNTEEGRA